MVQLLQVPSWDWRVETRRQKGDPTVTTLYWTGLAVAIGLFIYLLVAMLKPESMQ